MLVRLPIVVLTDREARRDCGVNGLHVETVEGSREGTVITFASGTTLTVMESFGEVLLALRRAGRRRR